MSHRFLTILAVVFLLSSQVAGAAHPSRVPMVHRVGTPSASGWIARDANPRHPWLYVATQNDIVAFDLKRRVQVGKITDSINSPGGIALDASGALYVPNETRGT